MQDTNTYLCPHLPSAIRLARSKIKQDDPMGFVKYRITTECERLRIAGQDPYWLVRLDKALSRGDFRAVNEYLAKLA